MDLKLLLQKLLHLLYLALVFDFYSFNFSLFLSAMQDLNIGFLSANQSTVKSKGREFLELLCNSLPAFTPVRYGA